MRDAIKHEVREDTGLSVDLVRLVGVYSDPSSQIVEYADGRVLHCIAICFECKVSSGTLTLSSETEHLRYFDPYSLSRKILSNHPIRIQDALANRQAAYIR